MKHPASVMCLMTAVLLESNTFIPASSAEMRLSREAAAEVPKADSEVVFRVSDVNLRSGLGTQFPVIRVLENVNGSAEIFYCVSENWVKIVFGIQMYWEPFTLISQGFNVLIYR